LMELPVEGLIHVTSLADDFYYLEEGTHTLVGRRSGKRYRLGDRVQVRVGHVDVDRRDLGLVMSDTPTGRESARARRAEGDHAADGREDRRRGAKSAVDPRKPKGGPGQKPAGDGTAAGGPGRKKKIRKKGPKRKR
jgi:ribonuclease R